MDDAKPKNAAAVALVSLRWSRMTAEERKEHARKMAAARWKGHKAARPVSSRR